MYNFIYHITIFISRCYTTESIYIEDSSITKKESILSILYCNKEIKQYCIWCKNLTQSFAGLAFSCGQVQGMGVSALLVDSGYWGTCTIVFLRRLYYYLLYVHIQIAVAKGVTWNSVSRVQWKVENATLFCCRLLFTSSCVSKCWYHKRTSSLRHIRSQASHFVGSYNASFCVQLAVVWSCLQTKIPLHNGK